MTANNALQLLLDILDRRKKGHTAEDIINYLCDMLSKLARK